MIKMYVKVALRNLLRNKFYSIINIAGLSIGIAVAVMIFSFVWFERSFDRFHSKSDQIYRVIQSKHIFEKEEISGITGAGLVSALKEEFPEIIFAGSLVFNNLDIEIKYGSGKFREKKNELIKADAEIFKIFDIHFIQGNPKTAFQDPNSIILTEEEAKKEFGSQNPMGQFITTRIPGEDEIILKVTGVVKSMPKNSHFHFKYLVPHDWFPWWRFSNDQFIDGWYTSYIVLPKGYNPSSLVTKLPDLVKKYYAPGIEKRVKTTYEEWLNSGGYWKLNLQPLKQIHLGSYSFWEPPFIMENKGNLLRVQMYTIIALLIIFLACINYITLSIAKSEARTKEIGVRKVNGATRKQLIFQFLVESILISFIAFFVAILMVNYVVLSFNKLLDIQATYNYFEISFILITLFAFTLLIGVLSGGYNAFHLSNYRPINLVKGQLLVKSKGMRIRNSLVIFQFSISIILIISSSYVYKQFVYMHHKNLGFEKDNIIIIKNPPVHSRLNGRKLSFAEKELRIESLRREVLKFPSVTNAAYLGPIPGKSYGYNSKTIRLKGVNRESAHVLYTTFIDYPYLDVFGLKMAAGKNFSQSSSALSFGEGIIINKAAAKQLGLIDPVGKYIYTDLWETIINDDGEEENVNREKEMQIIGVFKDFHNRSLYEEIKPTIYFQLSIGYRLAITFLPGQMPNNLDFLEKTWDEFTEEPLEYFYFNKEFEELYMKEKKLAQAFTFFTILAIIIACLGIFGLATLSMEQRTKEIGIRKVNGATIKEILFMLNKDFVKWVGIAFVIGCPVSYYAMSKWLENFAYRTTLNWGIFALAGGITLVIALLTVSWQSYKAATRNPVEVLKDE